MREWNKILGDSHFKLLPTDQTLSKPVFLLVIFFLFSPFLVNVRCYQEDLAASGWEASHFALTQ